MPKYTDIGRRLRKFAEEHYPTIAEFARALGKNASQELYPYLRGDSRPGADLQEKLRAVGADVDYIMTGKRRPRPEQFEATHYPLVSHIYCSPGTVATVHAYEIESKKKVSGPEGPEYEGGLFFEVKGSSMEPRWENGDLVLVQPKMKPKNGEYGVVCWDQEEGALKRVYYRDGRIVLMSLNQGFPPIVLDKEAVWFMGVVLLTKHGGR